MKSVLKEVLAVVVLVVVVVVGLPVLLLGPMSREPVLPGAYEAADEGSL